jgi:hypothetical protein
MPQVNNKYSFKDAYRLLRAVATKAEELADSKEQMIITQLEKSVEQKDRSNFGLLSLKNNSEKTVKVYTEEEQAEVDRLQAEILKLKAEINKLGKTQVVKESYKSLVYHKTTDAEEEALMLLQDLINSLGNATFIRAASGTTHKHK